MVKLRRTIASGYSASMPKSHASLCQVIWRQFDGHPVTGQDAYVMLAHLARQVGQYLVPVGDLNFERSVPHTLDHCSIYRDHVFFWNDVTSFPHLANAAPLRKMYVL